MIKNFLSGIIGLIYPPKCVFCGKLLNPNQSFCQSCVTPRNQIICPICYESYNDCRCQYPFEIVLAPFEYSGNVKKAILRLKYRADVPTIKCFAGEMAEVLRRDYKDFGSSILVPVPINQRILKARGYNQSQLLAEELGKLLRLETNNKLLLRTEDSLPQHSLGQAQRWVNAQSSFAPAGDFDLTNKFVVLIDDVATTGATLSACSGALRKLGATRIVALCASST